MSSEFLAISGRTHTLIDKKRGEVFSFSEFGEPILDEPALNYTIDICASIVECNILSIVGNSSCSDIYYKDKHAIIDGVSTMRCFTLLKNTPTVSIIPYRIKHDGVTHILLAVKPEISREYIETKLKVGKNICWESL